MAQSAEIERGSNLPYFNFVVIDEDSRLNSSYALRYDIYCLEKGFLSPEDYPDEMEMDIYDNYSIHLGCIDKSNILIGTLRLVLYSHRGFPLFDHCELFDKYKNLADPNNEALATAAEISRLAIIRPCRRRAGDGLYGFVDTDDSAGPSKGNERILHRRHRSEIVLGLYKAMYQVSKRQGITHWLAAMERSLMRLLYRHCFRFKAIGAEVDYHGPVTPYMVEIADIEKLVFDACPELLTEFIDGLEPEYFPDIVKNNEGPKYF